MQEVHGAAAAPNQEQVVERPAGAYIVGLKYEHHADHSGYSGFTRYLGVPLKLRLRNRWLDGRMGPRLDALAAATVRRPRASVSLLLLERVAKRHMRSNRGGLYHVLHGDTDFSGRSRRVAFPTRTKHLAVLVRASRATGNQIVATFHKPFSILNGAGVDRSVISALDGAILVSSSQRPFFSELLEPERIHVVHHGVDTEFFHPAEALPVEPVCVAVGSYLRDFRCLAHAMQHVWARNPAARLIAVGTQRYGDRHLQELGDERVEFLDNVDDGALRNAYRRARLAVFALEDATVNNALLEAMACGLPIVSSDVGGVKEYAGEGCIVCPPRDPEALANGVLRVLADSSLAERLGGASRTRALARDYRIVAEDLQRAYETIAALPQPRPRLIRTRPGADLDGR
jgi:glycosyltransferase involved in cell wall biosynthesis